MRSRRHVKRSTLLLLRPLFRYSIPREAYVLRAVGHTRGPVLVAREAPPPSDAETKPLDARFNCFDTLRLCGALLVLVSHSFALSGRREPSIGRESLGHIGVLLFFGISGYLITQSWLREPRFLTYVAKRALRILPALIAVVLLVAFVLGPLVTTSELGAYFESSTTWRYVAGNVAMFPQYNLPGVFADNPYPDGANGSLWTLVHEVHAYAIVALLGIAGIFRRRLIASAVLVLITLAAIKFPSGTHGIGDPRLLRAFAVGAILLLWRSEVPWNAPIAALAALVAVVTASLGAGEWVWDVVVPYVTIYAAFRIPTFGRAITRHGDFSYGLYLWAFPVQQVIASRWHDVSPAAMTAVALPVTFVVAVGSWKLVEKPALRFKTMVVSRRAPLAEPA